MHEQRPFSRFRVPIPTSTQNSMLTNKNTAKSCDVQPPPEDTTFSLPYRHPLFGRDECEAVMSYPPLGLDA